MNGKNRKDNVRLADLLRGICAGGMLLFALLGQAKPGPVPLILALLSVVVFAVVELLLNRCPHCGSYLGRNWGRFCQHCSERIRGEEGDT